LAGGSSVDGHERRKTLTEVKDVNVWEDGYMVSDCCYQYSW